MITIRRTDGSVLTEIDVPTVRDAVERLVADGFRLDRADLRGADLRGARLGRADLVGADLRGANLRDARLAWADLREANMAAADVTGAKLLEATMHGVNLSGAIGLPKAPVVPNIDREILRCIRAGGRLEMCAWHICKTTHCRAGWAVVVAGEEGRKLEEATSTYLAGRLIYEASRPGQPCPDFFCANEAAMADLIACAGEDA